MVLTDREIESALKHGHISIEPAPDVTFYSSTSVDLTLSPFLSFWRAADVPGLDTVISPAAEGYQYSRLSRALSEPIEIGSDGYILGPNAFVLGWTHETIELPSHSRLAARVEGKSSLARLAIGVHITAPTIHAGFKGPIQLEIWNHGPLRVRLMKGMRVCQLIFEQTLGTPEKGYSGQFFGQAKK
jgi:dCTP deaminase